MALPTGMAMIGGDDRGLGSGTTTTTTTGVFPSWGSGGGDGRPPACRVVGPVGVGGASTHCRGQAGQLWLAAQPVYVGRRWVECVGQKDNNRIVNSSRQRRV